MEKGAPAQTVWRAGREDRDSDSGCVPVPERWGVGSGAADPRRLRGRLSPPPGATAR